MTRLTSFLFDANLDQDLLYQSAQIYLIHEADPQSQQVVIIVFAHVVRSSVRSHFSKQSKFQAKAMFTTGLAEWIIDDTCLVVALFSCLEVSLRAVEIKENQDLNWLLQLHHTTHK